MGSFTILLALLEHRVRKIFLELNNIWLIRKIKTFAHVNSSRGAPLAVHVSVSVAMTKLSILVYE